MNKKSDFGKCNLPNHRVIGINDNRFMITQEINPSRINICYFSEEFKNMVDELYDLESNNKNFSDQINRNMNIQKLFLENLDNLKDLSWKNNGYY
jgi:hypothetical protein